MNLNRLFNKPIVKAFKEILPYVVIGVLITAVLILGAPGALGIAIGSSLFVGGCLGVLAVSDFIDTYQKARAEEQSMLQMQALPSEDISDVIEMRSYTQTKPYRSFPTYAQQDSSITASVASYIKRGLRFFDPGYSKVSSSITADCAADTADSVHSTTLSSLKKSS